MGVLLFCVLFFFFNDTATTEIYTLSLHDALPISSFSAWGDWRFIKRLLSMRAIRSEEHTSELQSRFGISYAVFCLKKKKKKYCRKPNRPTSTVTTSITSQPRH